jgi:mannose-6-phosphate isomerase-like protein (cupin superfamily)
MKITSIDSCPEYYFEERCFITELLNRANSPALSVAQARVEPGVTTVLHTLKGTEVYFLLHGKGEVEVGGDRAFVQAGDLVHIPPGIPQRITNTGVEDLRFLAICSPRFKPEDYRQV